MSRCRNDIHRDYKKHCQEFTSVVKLQKQINEAKIGKGDRRGYPISLKMYIGSLDKESTKLTLNVLNCGSK